MFRIIKAIIIFVFGIGLLSFTSPTVVHAKSFHTYHVTPKNTRGTWYGYNRKIVITRTHYYEFGANRKSHELKSSHINTVKANKGWWNIMSTTNSSISAQTTIRRQTLKVNGHKRVVLEQIGDHVDRPRTEVRCYTHYSSQKKLHLVTYIGYNIIYPDSPFA